MSSIHQNHRKRLRQKFIEGGIHSLAEHEILELALFYSKPRSNTNELAHRLIEKFGSLRGVCTASDAELLSVSGIGADSVAFIRFLTEFGMLYRRPLRVKEDSFKSIASIGDYFTKLFENEASESVFAMLFSKDGELLCVEQIGDGSDLSSSLPLKNTLEHAVSMNAAAIALGHCHPAGDPTPSHADISITRDARFLSDGMGIYFIDHFIVCGNTYFSVRHKETNMPSNEPNT